MIHNDIIDRYLTMIGDSGNSINMPPDTDLPHLTWMLLEISIGNMDVGKENRWLGFIQGVLIMRGITTV